MCATQCLRCLTIPDHAEFSERHKVVSLDEIEEVLKVECSGSMIILTLLAGNYESKFTVSDTILTGLFFPTELELTQVQEVQNGAARAQRVQTPQF